MTTRADIEAWLRAAKADHRWMLVLCDTFDNYSDFPSYCSTAEEVHDKIAKGIKNGDKLMECYDLSVSILPQLDEHRAMHLPLRPEAKT